MISEDFDLLVEAARRSVLGRAVQAMAVAADASYRTSASTRGAFAVERAFVRMSGAERLQTACLVIAFALFCHALLLLVVPPYVAPGMPVRWILAAGVLALAVAALAPRVHASWHASALRRLWRLMLN